MPGSRHGEKGQAIVENMLTMLVLCLVLVGLLQVFHVTVAKLLTQYSSFCTARSYSVGFADYLLDRSSRVAAIGASGRLVSPDNQDYNSPVTQYYSEQFMIPEYIQGIRWLEYEYWYGENEYDETFYASDTDTPRTYLGNNYRGAADAMVEVNVEFSSYPFAFFDLIDRNRVWFEGAGGDLDIDGSSQLANHAADYLSSED